MMLTQNSKMRKATLRTFNFDIPAGKTCIGADKCLAYCYATKGFYQMPNVRAKHESNLASSKTVNFVNMMSAEIYLLEPEAIRIHSAGDFYSREYLSKWLSIADRHPDIVFYCYTKSIPLFIGIDLPENFKVIYSRGGKYDHLIDLHGLRSCSLVGEYSEDNDTSDDNDSMIIFSDKNIELLQRWG